MSEVDEPIYTFIRGKGWVPEYKIPALGADVIVVSSASGKQKIYVCKRMPQEGEPFIQANEWSLERAAEHVRQFDWHVWAPWRAWYAGEGNAFALVIEDVSDC